MHAPHHAALHILPYTSTFYPMPQPPPPLHVISDPEYGKELPEGAITFPAVELGHFYEKVTP